MRIAKCTKPLQVTALGNLGSVTVTQGWEGDVDAVIGRTDRGPFTVADGLGDHLNTTNFEFVTRDKPSSAKSKAAATPQE